MTEDRYYKRTLIKEELPSRVMGETRRTITYLPPGFNEVLSYPAIYCQDGLDFFQFGRIATLANRLILDEGMEPVIICGVETDKAWRTAEYAPEGERFAAYCRFFGEELVPYVESRFPVRPNAAERVIAGDSLGATVSLHLALQHPELFTRVISLSGAFREATEESLQAAADLSWLRLFMVVGLEEEAVNTSMGVLDILGTNRRVQRLLEEKGAQAEYFEKPGRHIWGFWQQELAGAIRHFLP